MWTPKKGIFILSNVFWNIQILELQNWMFSAVALKKEMGRDEALK